MTTVVNVVTTTGTQYEVSQVNSVPRNDGKRNRPQYAAMSTASALCIVGGMEMALGLGWNINTNILTTQHFQFCWFIGVIAGAIISAALIHHLRKRIVLLISLLLVLASGIIYVSVPAEYAPIIAARYISGIGIGLAMVTFIVHGSEVSTSSCRGTVLTLEQYFFTVGIAIQVIYASQWTTGIDFAANRLHGILVIVLAVIALGLLYFVIESPIYYIRKCDDETALECLRLLERPQIVTNQTKFRLEELKNYVTQEENQSLEENLQKSILPFLKVLLYRFLVPFMFSLPLSGAIEIASLISLGYQYSWPPLVYIVLRIFGGMLTLCLADGLGRKLTPLIALVCMAGLSIGIGLQFRNNLFLLSSYQMSIVCALLLVSQFFAGLYTPNSSVYLGEAFSLVLKPYMIAFCICVEQLIHIITIVSFKFSVESLFVYFITIGCIMFVLFIYFCVALPETRHTRLSEAQTRFRSYFNLKMF